jgi:protein-S-isoprenylcysteine O-methyltransferase Ste14
MNEQSFKLLFKFARLRVAVSRIFAVLVMLLIIFTASSIKQGGLADILLQTSGLFLLTVCSIGRLWALLYISGKKTHEVVTDGPYSIVRHPLYLFSFIGAIGIGLVSENILVLGTIVIFYLSYYPLTILSEEKHLTKKYGQVYIDYAKRTPRFLPKPSRYKSPDFFMVNAEIFLKNMAIGMWFVWTFILLNVIDMLQTLDIIHVLLRVP